MRGQMIILWGFNRGVTSTRYQNSATKITQHQIEWNCQCEINNQICAPTSASTAQRFSSSDGKHYLAAPEDVDFILDEY